MIRNDVKGMADRIDALEEEIRTLNRLDPHDPQIAMLHGRLTSALHDLYRSIPRGV